MRAREFIKEVGLAVSKPKIADTGSTSSTGGQTFSTAQGTKHFANPSNPNKSAPPTQADLKAQIRANQQAKLKQSSLANLPFAKDSKPSDVPLDQLIGQYAMAGTPKPSAFTKKPAAPAAKTDPIATGAAMSQAADAAMAAGKSPQDVARAILNTPKTPITPSGTPSSAPSAPSLGQPAAAAGRQAGQDILKNLAKTGITPNAPQNKTPQGFWAGLSKGFKQGMGMDSDRSLASNLTQAGLGKLGLSNTGDTVAAMSNRISDKEKQKAAANTPPVTTPGAAQIPKAGQTIKDPITGRGSIKVLPNPGGKGIKLDTTKSLGYPIIIDPKDLA